MSLDLWNAFADGTEDPSENPWAQPTSNGETNGINRMETRPLGATLPSQITGGWNDSNKGQTEWRDSAVMNEALPARSVDTNSGPGTENVWTTSHSYREELPPWSVSEDLSGVPRHSPILPPPQGIAQDDDFGDFETPDLHQPFDKTVQKQVPFTISKEMPFDQGQTPHVSATLPLYNKTLSYQVHNPYSDIEKLENPPLDQVLRPESQNADVSYWESPPVKKMDKSLWGLSPVESRASLSIAKDLDVPYGAKEWEEFSADPPTSPGFNQEKVLPGRNRKDQSLKSASHSPPQSVPPTEGKEDSKKLPVSTERAVSPTTPSNVPPPSILISQMTTLIQKLPSQVEEMMLRSAEGHFSQEGLDKALRGCIASLRVSARILAGRKVRWKRDSHLSQSMKIGPAQAGKKGGMKLTGVDKAETQREDREVAEFVRFWKERLGSIRAALATVNGQISGSPLVLPEISERMVIFVAKASQGSLNASRGCVLCGLKREERIAKVDVDIWDGFEEWWSDFWGHTECRVFWEEHERFLQQR